MSTAKVTQTTFLGLLWAGTGVSLCFLLFRLFVRIKSFRKLFWDDFLVVAAWGMLLGTAVLWQVEAPTLYEQYAVEAGPEPFSLEFIDRDTAFLHTIVPFIILFYSCLWTVKLSFLIFFRRLGSNVTGQKIWWWCILGITILTWIACIADIDYKCSMSSFAFIISYCPSLSAIRYVNRTFYANCAADVITDCLIISIPVLILWHVQIPLRRKLILFAIFSVTVVVIIVSIVRVALVNSGNQDPDISWLYFWSNIEMATSIIIACVASFRQLFISTQNQHQFGRPSESTPRRSLLSYFRFRSKFSNSSGAHTKWPTSHGRRQDLLVKPDSQTHIVPLDRIHVSHSVDISNTISENTKATPQQFNFERTEFRK